MRQLFLVWILAFTCFGLWSQRNFIEEGVPVIQVQPTDEKIVLDGILDEAVWARCKAGSGFSQYFPSDTIDAAGNTEVYFCADDEFLYVAAVCYSNGDKFQVPTLKRDYGFRDSDNISILFDTYNDNTNALLFGINAYGSRREATIANGGRKGSDFDNSWDNKWYGDASRYEDKWIGEIAIPFKALRFNDGIDSWRINAYRYDAQCNEITTWISIPRNRILMDMSYMGNLVWDKPLKKSSSNISVIPYVIGSSLRDFEDLDESDPQLKTNIGGDVKVGITSGLNLDLTINPDFSQVEVDQQVTNLDRFEIFFPEKRQFFLENADLFGNFGDSNLNPFFSRRIGVALDTTTGVNIQNPVHYGARLSGKVNEKLRVGLLNMQTASDQTNGLPIFNYSIIAVEQKVQSKSTVAFIAQNKQAIKPNDFNGDFDSFNRLVGLEYRYFSENDKWFGKASLMRVFSETAQSQNYANFLRIGYNVRRWQGSWEHSIIGNGFDAQMGFVPRKDILKISPLVVLNFYPEKSKISNHNLSFSYDQFFKLGKEVDSIVDEFQSVENRIKIEHENRFSSGIRFDYYAEYFDIFLLNNFDPTRVQDEDIFLSAGSSYQFLNFGIDYSSDNRKKFIYSFNSVVGQFFNGTRINFGTNLTYRFRPYGSIALQVNYNRLELEAPFKKTDLWLVGPKLDMSFSKTVFLTSFFQYNNQLDNLNINTRLQWRFRPASDLFFVYTDNYLTDSFSQFEKRNRAFVLKINYWLSL